MTVALRTVQAWAAALALVLLAAPAMAQFTYTDNMRKRDAGLLQAQIAALAPQRAGTVDLYAVGFAGDSTENVFRNEVHYFEDLMAQRFGAQGRTLALVNHADSLFVRPRPLATLDNLREALAGVGKAIDPEEDVLLLFMTMHGTPDHRLQVQMAPTLTEWLHPDDIREVLDDSGIRNRVIVISACFAGGFIPALRDEHTLVLTAARSNRPSFGCGTASAATYFGRAWMIEGLNETTDFMAAFESAKVRIRKREQAEGFDPSLPQSYAGKAIGGVMDAWQAQLVPGPALPYPYAESDEDTDNTQPEAEQEADDVPDAREDGGRDGGLDAARNDNGENGGQSDSRREDNSTQHEPHDLQDNRQPA